MKEWSKIYLNVAENLNVIPLISGLEACQKLIEDLEGAHEDGKYQVEEFMNERVYSDNISIYRTIQRNSRLNFVKTKYVKEPSTSVSTKEMESEGLGAVVALLNDNSQIEVFEYCITPESLATFNPNGTFRKCQKSKLIQCMNTKKAEDISYDYIAFVDMGMFISNSKSRSTNQRERSIICLARLY